MQLRILQTSDDRCYLPMLQASGALTQRFCDRHGFTYQPYVGMVRGQSPVHAAYNRVFLLHDLVTQGYDGWVLYLDADAWIHDLDFDVRGYLAGQAAQADFIAAEASPDVHQTWAINNGVFFINLGSLVGRRIVIIWHHLVQALVPQAHWDNPQAGWAPPEYDDQNLLYRTLASNPDILARVKKESGDLLNYRGRFVRQCLRADYPTFDERLAHVRAVTQQLLAEAGVDHAMTCVAETAT